MRFFFRTRQFRIIATVISAVLVISLAFGLTAKRMAPYSDVAGIITAPFRSAYTAVSNEIKDFVTAYKDGNELLLKNSELNEELSSLRKKVADYQKIKADNDFYKNYLGIKEQNNDFTFAPATVISRDKADLYCGFTINKGSLSKIKVYDPVITEDGLVGYITEVGTTTAKVSTILSPDITLGALDSRTSDSGIVSGNIKLAKDKECRFSNLSKTSGVALGDYVVTSGEGVFPDGLLIGYVKNVGTGNNNSSIYADIVPFADFLKIRNVMVITSFEGQGETIKPED